MTSSRYLSIPLWCDWGYWCQSPRRPSLNTFQSHCGAIGAMVKVEVRIETSAFQSHCGAIGACIVRRARPGSG